MATSVTFLCCLLGLLTVTSAFNFGDYTDDETERGNEFVDKVVKDITEEHGNEYDPYRTDDSKIGIYRQVMFVNVSGEAKLHNCYITGLTTIHRSGPCFLEREDERMKVTADLGAGVLEYHCDGTVQFMKYGPSIHTVARLHYVEVNMVFTVDGKTGGNGKLLKFHTDDMRGIEIKISGLGNVLNWTFNTLISWVTTVCRGYIRHAIEKVMAKHVEEKVENYIFPIAGVETTTTPAEVVETSLHSVTLPTTQEEREQTFPTEQ